MEDIGTDGRIAVILKLILSKENVYLLSAFIWLRIRPVDRFLWETSGVFLGELSNYQPRKNYSDPWS